MFDYFQKLTYLDHLIRTKATGSCTDLARKLKISKAQTYRYIDFLKEIGGPIKYDIYKKTFFYSESVIFNFGYRKK